MSNSNATQNGHSPEPGPSLIEKIEYAMDDTMDELSVAHEDEQIRLDGVLNGLAMALTILRNPYLFDDEDESKFDEAVKETVRTAQDRYSREMASHG